MLDVSRICLWEQVTYCIKNGFWEVGFLLPHNRPAQPMISPTPPVITVGNKNHILARSACPR